MNHPLNKLRTEAKLLKLSSTEKAALHATLMQAMQKSGYGSPDASAVRMMPSPFYFAPKFAMSFAAFVLLVLAGGGTAFAAKGALPGDLLYSVKTIVNEPVEGALALSVESKIKFHSDVAQTRLEEAEVLASQNRLDASTTQKLESDIDTHLSQRDELAQSLDEKTPGASAMVVSELDSAIAAHGEVLAVLGSESKSTTTRNNTDSLVARTRLASASNTGAFHATLMMAKAAPMMAPSADAPRPTAVTMSLTVTASEDASTSDASNSSVAASSTENQPEAQSTGTQERSLSASRDQKAALALEMRATSSLESLKRSADETRGQIDASVAAKLDARLSKVSALIAQGEAALSDRDYDSAKDSFSQALDKSATLSIFISANARFDSGILGNLLNSNPGEEGGE
jgi:hypothetical protein